MAAQVVSFHCVLKNSLGQIISRTTNHDVIATTSDNETSLKPLSEALCSLQKGEKKTVFVAAKDAYGFYNPKLRIQRRRIDLSGADDLLVGDSVKYISHGESRMFKVVEASSQLITLDGNHPLAGQDLIFEIEGTACRAASPGESLELVETPKALLH